MCVCFSLQHTPVRTHTEGTRPPHPPPTRCTQAETPCATMYRWVNNNNVLAITPLVALTTPAVRGAVVCRQQRRTIPANNRTRTATCPEHKGMKKNESLPHNKAAHERGGASRDSPRSHSTTTTTTTTPVHHPQSKTTTKKTHRLRCWTHLTTNRKCCRSKPATSKSPNASTLKSLTCEPGLANTQLLLLLPHANY